MVVFFALWLTVLKPSSSGSAGSPALGQYQPAINAAKASAASQNAAAAAAGNTISSRSAKPAATTTKPAATTTKPAATAAKPAATAAKPATSTPATPTQRMNVVDRALADHKALALLFYNPAAPDDQAVKRELESIPTRRGLVVKLAIPLSEVASYPVVTTQVLIQTSPTLVLVDRGAQAFTLVGFADGFAISRWVNDALNMR
jgi:hypothetical protein